MTKLARMALELLPIIIVLIVLIWVILYFANSFVERIVPTQKSTYQNVSKVKIDYPAYGASAVYTIEHQSKTIKAIVNDINSQSYGKWRDSLGGKEGASAISIHL